MGISIIVVFALLALADGGLLFGKKAGLVKGAFKTLFKQEKQEEQHCEIKWEDVWKPHCTTTYEKICKQEPKKECSTEWKEECWTEHEEKCHTEWVEECWEEDEEICEWQQDCHEPQEHHYSSRGSHGSSSHGSSESAGHAENVQDNVGTTKRSAQYEDDVLEEIDEKILSEALENIPASELLKLSQEMAELSKESSDTGVATIGESREKRSLHLFNLHLLGKHLASKAAANHLFGKAAKTILGTTAAGKGIAGKTAAGKAIAGTTAAGKAFAGKAFAGASSSKFSGSSHSSHSSHHKKCKNVKKCWWKPVKKCQETPVENCWE